MASRWECVRRPAPAAGPKDLNKLHAALLKWIAEFAAHAKNRKELEAILNKHMYQWQGNWYGDPRAAIREMMDSLTDAAQSELSTWERFLSDTSDPLENKPASGIKNVADLVSTVSDVTSLIGEWAAKAGSADLKLALEAVEKAQSQLNSAAGPRMADLDNLIARAKRLVQEAEKVPGSSDLTKNLENFKKWKSFKDSLTDMEKLREKVKTMFATADQFAKEGADFAKAWNTVGNAVSFASFSLGMYSRYETLIRRGYDPKAALAYAAMSAATYTAVTSIPAVAAIDLAQTGAEWGGVPGVKDRSLSNGFDMLFELAAYADYRSAVNQGKDLTQAALNALPEARVREMLTSPGRAHRQRGIAGRDGQTSPPPGIAQPDPGREGE